MSLEISVSFENVVDICLVQCFFASKSFSRSFVPQ